jgi:phenylalanyl-tRNA synthetase beta chain
MPDEPLELCALLAGDRAGWLGDTKPVDFYDAKGTLELVLRTLYGSSEGFEVSAADKVPAHLHPGISARITDSTGKEIGWIGEIHPKVREAFDVDGPVFGFELSVDKMPMPKDFGMVAIPRFPSITRDISMLLDVAVQTAQVAEIIKSTEEPLLQEMRILEDYRDPAHVPEGKKGMLWSITYRSPERTLTDAEVDKAHQALEDRLLGELGASRR